jgi:hypothetical protein
VYKAVDKKTAEIVAVKVMDRYALQWLRYMFAYFQCEIDDAIPACMKRKHLACRVFICEHGIVTE